MARLQQINVPRVGRNDPCPCGSGKKYKKCHLVEEPRAQRAAPTRTPQEITFDLGRLRSFDPCPCGSGKTFGACHESQTRKMQELNTRSEAKRLAWEARFGEVRPPIHADFQGYKFVGVGSELHYVKESDARSFHDFLIRYLAAKVGRAWWEAEVRKPLDERHPIMQWYVALFRLREKTTEGRPGEIVTVVPDGPTLAFMQLAYDLFIVQDNKALEKRMLRRLLHPEQFQGARYELFATATCIRAGFDITLEQEGDGSRTHPEFTAVHRHTGQKIALEAKSRQRPGVLGFHPEWPAEEPRRANIRDLLLAATEKDVDVPPMRR